MHICIYLKMFLFILIFYSFQVLLVESAKFDGRVYPSQGQVWPKPQIEKKGNEAFSIKLRQFNVLVTNNDCKMLRKAVARTIRSIRPLTKIVKSEKSIENIGIEILELLSTKEDEREILKEIRIELKNPCEDFPYMGMDESYNLTVKLNTTLKSPSIWGIIRGLETFSQLFYMTEDRKEVLINGTEIVDFPRYPHRGLMLDTSRNYIGIRAIEILLDAMAMNKMNVFHWHIVDNDSFPYKSLKFPELSNLGAFHKSLVYKKQAIYDIVRYAADRGIRVIPEFNMPGHSEPIRKSHPEIMAKKCKSGQGLLNPLKNETYYFINELLEEVQQAFPDQYIHIGGDSVDVKCWKHDEEIYNRKLNNYTVDELYVLFMHNVMPLLPSDSKVIVWQDVNNHNIPLPKDALIQVWWRNWVEEMIAVASNGQRVLFSTPWYLDNYRGYSFDSMYQSDPARMVREVTKNATLLKYIMGGEACLLTPRVNEDNLHTTIWPRTSAVAEVLWSEEQDTAVEISKETRARIEEHACRMLRRSVPVEPPNGPGFCNTMLK